jgi:putative resolvase
MRNGKKEEARYISTGHAAVLTGLDGQTIRKMVDKKEIPSYIAPSGHRRIDREGLQRLLRPTDAVKALREGEKQNFLYTRVSTKKQMDDLSRQVEFVSRPEFSGYTLISDIGSGINFKRKGIQTLLDRCIQGLIGEVVIAHRDRLCRFGFELIEQIIQKAGGRITVLSENEDPDESKELADDLLAIIHVFSCRQMGRRSYKIKKDKVQKHQDKDVSNDTAETDSY